MDQDIRHKVCRLIAGIVVADDDFDAAEEAFVDRLLVKFGVPQELRDELFPIMDANEAAEEFAAMPREVQLEAFELLVQAAAADKTYAVEERGYLHTVGKVIALSPEQIDARVNALIGS